MANSPTKPGLTAVQEVHVETWDEFLAEATKDLKPFRMPLPDGDVLEVECPSSDDLTAVGAAQQTGDTAAMAVAVFGDQAAKVLTLVGALPFPVMLKLVGKVMAHYGQSLSDLPES